MARSGTSLLRPIKLMLAKLAERECSAEYLAEVTGCRKLTIYSWLRYLNKEPKLVYISSWRKVEGVRGPPTALWSAGTWQPNAPRPPKLTQAERYQRSLRAKSLANERKQRAPKARDPLRNAASAARILAAASPWQLHAVQAEADRSSDGRRFPESGHGTVPCNAHAAGSEAAVAAQPEVSLSDGEAT